MSDNAYFFYTKINSSHDESFFKRNISELENSSIKQSILKYKRKEDKILSLVSKLLLKNILMERDEDYKETLKSFKLNDFKKPVIANGNISFAHSGNYAGAVYCKNSKVGLDIQYKDSDIIEEPLKYIIEKYDYNWGRENFYKYWCRLESILKAFGTGFLIETDNVKIEKDFGEVENKRFFFQEIDIEKNFMVVIASEKLIKVEKKFLVNVDEQSINC